MSRLAARPAALVLAMVFGTLVLVHAQDGAVFKDPAAESLVRLIRGAVGQGEGKVMGLRSLLLRGHSRVVFGDGPPVDAVTEVRILLPDHCVRVDVAPASRLITGFAGDKLLTAVEDADGVTRPPANMQAGLLKVEQGRLARFLLGMTGYVSPAFFITFRSIGGMQSMVNPAESAATARVTQGRLEDNIVEGTGRDNFFVRLTVDGAKLPTRLEYRATKSSMSVMEFSDRRQVEGMRLPFHVTTSDGKRVIDDLLLSQIGVNVQFSETDFQLLKR
jgi:hypothetical protein